MGKPIAVRERLGAGVRARALRHARGQMQKRPRPLRTNETRQRPGALGLSEKSQFQR